MNFSDQTERRESGVQRPRINRLRNNQQEWVVRGSSAITAASSSSGIIPSSSQKGNDNEVVGEPIKGHFQPVQKLNRTHWGPRPRGNSSRHGNRQREKQRDQGMDSVRENEKVLKDSHLPQLLQEIQEKLLRGSIECMICYEMVRRSSPIWSCSSCYSIFHLNCIKKWARAPTSGDSLAEKNQGSNWRCPGCQFVQLVSSKDIRYVCYCGKRPEPPSDLYLTPHSCGEQCGKQLQRETSGSDMSKEYLCPHVCVLQCHPGPCPPCKAFAPPCRCPCGKEVITTRCSDRKSVLTCGKLCDKLLDCGRHHCERVCHMGPCDPCQIIVDSSCFCKKKIEKLLCGDVIVKGDIKFEDGVFSCSSICEKTLNCGNHVCVEACHPGSCGECELLPSKIKACCCGKTSLQEERKSCLDLIPTCSQICGKILPCGLHQCQEVCHSGICPPCPIFVPQQCRCGSTSRTVECYKTVSVTESFTCDKPCGQKKNCGRHRCNERCCPLSNSNSSLIVDWNPHLCTMACEKRLRCGQHPCTSLCHSGHCPPCLETIFTDLTCACGGTSIPPPLPCGTPLPSCQLLCSVPQSCGHSSSHSCHFGDCQPCSIPVAKECVGGHMVLRNIPCGSRDIRCNKLCGRTRQCGLHACSRTCHPLPCDSITMSSASSRASCGQTCGAPRRDCKHTCTAVCHPSSACPDIRCEFSVTITCSCGRISATVPCDAGGTSVDSVLEASVIQKLALPLQPVEGNGGRIPLGQRKLSCDDECAKMVRKKVLADAFDVNSQNLSALYLGDGALESEVLSDFLRRDYKWVLSIEERCKYLVLGKSRGGLNALKVHVFCIMPKEKRDAVRLIAERWKLSVSLAGWEPKRFVVVHVTPKSKVPARVLGVKGSNINNILHPPVFDSLVDMDPRLVVALFDMPREADISALVLRFGGECELVWLSDKNALAVFSDPARANTAMRRLDQGSVYYGAVVFPQNGGSSSVASGANAWGSTAANDGSSIAGLKGNPWKKAVLQDPNSKESSWDAEEWAVDASGSNFPVSKVKEVSSVPHSNRWSVLDPESTAKSSDESVRIEGPENPAVLGFKDEGPSSTQSPLLDQTNDFSGDVVDDWEKACE